MRASPPDSQTSQSSASPPRSRWTVGPLRSDEDAAASGLTAAAFTNDPYWLALGPRHGPLRRRLIATLTHSQLVHGRRNGDEILAVHAVPGELSAIARVAEHHGKQPPGLPPTQILICGPIALVGWLGAESRLAGLRPVYRHDYLYTLAVAPHRQRQGLGQALLTEVIERSAKHGRPLLLDTMTADNVVWYERFGFVVVGDFDLPRAHHAWLMRWRG